MQIMHIYVFESCVFHGYVHKHLCFQASSYVCVCVYLYIEICVGRYLSVYVIMHVFCIVCSIHTQRLLLITTIEKILCMNVGSPAFPVFCSLPYTQQASAKQQQLKKFSIVRTIEKMVLTSFLCFYGRTLNLKFECLSKAQSSS